MSSDLWIRRIAARFGGRFPQQPIQWRTLGRESEFPLVRADGSPGDLAEIWPVLAKNGPALTEKREKNGLLVELNCPEVAYMAEVGKGTVEIVLPPKQDLHEIDTAWRAAMARLLDAAEQTGQLVLGYGIQPKAPPSIEIMTPKQRYGVLLDTIGPGWLWFALTASDQAHARIAADEVVPFTNLGHLLTPLVIALCANSPIHSGAPCGVMSAREQSMGSIQAAFDRHGMPSGPDVDLEGMVRRLARQPFLVRVRDGAYQPMDGAFIDVATAGEPPPDEDAVFTDFLMHEHYIWNSARPRSAHGTIELRSACQQPLPEHMAAAALNVAIICAAPTLAAHLEATFGADTWPVMRAWHRGAVAQGLAAPEPAPGLIAELLDLCEAGLRARGRGEEVHLAPLRRRLAARENPAQAALRIWGETGLPGLVAHTARRP
jgi:gamma-glutamylcysteine synthetase